MPAKPSPAPACRTPNVPAATTSGSGAGVHNLRNRWLVAAVLTLAVAAVFLPAITHDFIAYDDPAYVTQNAHVTAGLSWPGIRWALTSVVASNWHPLTWVSHMLDCQLFGLNPAGHHLTSVLLHALNTLLLFVALRRLTGAFWRSVAVAALFGLHPLHVESVAWVSERKDVLSTTFWMLVLWVYAIRAGRLRAGRSGAALYAVALVCMALGLMAKPMLVTLPCVLLLLDFWPFDRWRDGDTRARLWLIAEKLPFFALSAGASATTFYAQRHGGTVGSLEDFTLPVRIGNALVAYAGYLGKCFLPANLSVFYPNFAQQPPAVSIVLAIALLTAITAATVALARRWPFLPVGWFWFAGTLVPVIGIVQVGGATMADRYTYVPLIGVFVALVWLVDAVSVNWVHRRAVLGTFGGALLGLLAGLTTHQLRYWRNGATLFEHANAVTKDNWVAHYNLYIAFVKTDPVAAQAELDEMKRIIAEFAARYERRGIALARTPAKEQEAIQQFRTAIRIMRPRPGPHYQLAMVLAKSPAGIPEAIQEFETAVQLKPDYFEAHLALAGLLASFPERLNECIAEYQAASALRPSDARLHYELGRALAKVSWRSGEALMHFEQAQKLDPSFQPARDAVEQMRRSP